MAHNRMARDTVTAALDNQQRTLKQLLSTPSSRSPVRKLSFGAKNVQNTRENIQRVIF